MKICPSCNRTYNDDTLSFCLADGSVLSAAHDPQETQRIPAPRSTNASPTEVLYPAPRQDDSPALLQPTIQAPQPPPFYSAKPQSQLPETRSSRTGLFIGVAVLLGIIIGVGLTVSFLMSGKDKVKDGGSESKIPNTNTTPTSTPGSTLTELPGERWEECERSGGEYCGVWTRVSSGRWHGHWNGVEADLTITVNGKNVTVTRHDLTATLQATYRGTLNAENTQIVGTVDWCCDRWGDRSGTWHAEISK
jgi:hypothetical protein